MTNAANSTNRLGILAQCLALASFLAILGTVPGLGAEASRPGVADRCAGADCPAPPARGVTVYRGLVLDYEVIDGMAVHGGDMVLGTAEEAAAAAPSREPAEPERPAGPARRDFFAEKDLWPGGRVPYEIDEKAFDDRFRFLLEDVYWAIEEWNSKTVIEFIPRTDEEYYVLITFQQPKYPHCLSAVGPRAPTTVWTIGCGRVASVHELGHAVGLLHEQQRADRDSFIMLENLSFGFIRGFYDGTDEREVLAERAQWTKYSPSSGHYGRSYDYGSVMHYLRGHAWRTIPPGITSHVRSILSTGDIDGVARLYGKPPGTVTVKTTPPGLDVLVDGERVTAPAEFDWLPDSVHTLEAPVLGHLGSRPHAFGRWSDGGDRERTVKVPGSTLFNAHYIELFKVHDASPQVGTIAVHPESPGRWYPRGSLVTITGTGTPQIALNEGGYLNFPSWNWAYIPVGTRLEVSDDMALSARYLPPPLYRISSNVSGLPVILSAAGESQESICYTPAVFHPSQLTPRVDVGAGEVMVPLQVGSRRAEGRYRFGGWSDGGGFQHRKIEVPAGGGSLTFDALREFELVWGWGRPTREKPSEVVVSPDSADGFYPAGTQVQLTAVPKGGDWFLGWEHDLTGTETTRSVIMDRNRRVMARFSSFEHALVPVGESSPQAGRPVVGPYMVRVPDDTSEVTVRFVSPAAVPNAEWEATFDGGEYFYGSDTITVTPEVLERQWTNALLDPGHWSQHLRIWQRDGGDGGSAWDGKLHVSIQRDWIDRVWPQAFTLVSQAGWPRPLRQLLRVVPVEGEVPHVRYRIVSDSHWLEAFPSEWTGGQGEAEIAVTANAAALGPEAYGGKLTILIDRDGDAAEGWTPTGIEIPVHFVVAPADTLARADTGSAPREMRSAPREIAVGRPAPGRLELAGDGDWFRFQTTAALTWVMAYTVSEGDTVGELHVAGSVSPLADDDSGSGANFWIATSVPAGTHYLRVNRPGHGPGHGPGLTDYTLVLEELPPTDAMEFVRIPAGSFVMGSPEDEKGRSSREGPQRDVTISQDFWMGKYEVTQGEWEAVLANGQGRFPGPDGLDCWRCPVREVTWDEVQDFIRILNGVEAAAGSSVRYRLPTEAEWEYAARAGTTGARYGELDEIAWWSGNSGADGSPRPVGQKEANAWGLHDMLGNVAEWTADWYRYRSYSTGGAIDPTGPPVGDGESRVARGGRASYGAGAIRSAWRREGGWAGFRLVKTAADRSSSSGRVVGDDHGDTWGEATEVEAVGATRGRLDRVGDEDWFRFRTTTSWTDISVRTVSEGDTFGELHVTGRDVETDDNGGNVWIEASVPAGTHYLRVSGSGPADYTLMLGSFVFDIGDDGDTRATATGMDVGGEESGVTSVGDEDWFRFRTTAAMTWITAYTVSEGGTTGELHVAGGGTVMDDDSRSGEGFWPKLGDGFSITAGVPAGTHYLRVSGSGMATDYKLKLQPMDMLALTAMEFVRIPAGSFVMGSPEGEGGDEDERPQREVTLSQDFWMGKYEVTVNEWGAVMGEQYHALPINRDNSSVTYGAETPRFESEYSSVLRLCDQFPGARCPMTANWSDVREFLRRLNAREAAAGSSARYRLPTEAEWEYAARAGTTGARYGELDEIAWYGPSDSRRPFHPVGYKRPNAWGLHDMVGNVQEWTADWYGPYSDGAVTDPTGPAAGLPLATWDRRPARVSRGGNGTSNAFRLRSAARGKSATEWIHGFRLVRTGAGGSSSFSLFRPEDADDHGDTRGTATEVEANASALGILGRVGDEDWFRFRTTAASTSITAWTVGGDTFGELHVAGGGTVADDDSGSGGNFRITAEVPAGTHYLRVSGSGPAQYLLNLESIPVARLDPIEFVRIPAGSFVMGKPEDEKDQGLDEFDEVPQRDVTISQDFWMGKYEVTQGEWEAVTGENPSKFKDCGPRCPVENVSWADAQEFIRKLNERESGSGYRYRLPTEAEWEYAARAGTTGVRHGELDEIAWHWGNSDARTHPVGEKRANAWGLHDMLGNVGEWVADRYGAYPSGAVTDPTGPSTGPYRVNRGGSWSHHAGLVRSADRSRDWPGHRFSSIGFRLARTD